MFGIRHVALAVNKMDLVEWSRPVFDEIELAYRRFAEDLSFETITAIPLSALDGHNVVEPGNGAMPWYRGPSLLQWLETVEPQKREAQQPFSMPVQWVNRPNLDFRGFSGRIGSGSIKPGTACASVHPAFPAASRKSPSGAAPKPKPSRAIPSR